MFPFEDVLVPIAAVCSPFVTAILIVFFVIQKNIKENTQKCEIVKKAIEANYPLPQDLFCVQKKDKNSNTFLSKTIVILGIGVGLVMLYLMLYSADTYQPIVFCSGLVFVLIGAGRVAMWIYLERKKNESGNKKNE